MAKGYSSYDDYYYEEDDDDGYKGKMMTTGKGGGHEYPLATPAPKTGKGGSPKSGKGAPKTGKGAMMSKCFDPLCCNDTVNPSQSRHQLTMSSCSLLVYSHWKGVQR